MNNTHIQTSGVKVLIVEDDDAVAKILENNIRKYYKGEVLCLREISPYSAIDRLTQEEDIVACLLDLGFPGMRRPGSTEAFDAIDSAIKKYRLDTALIVVSGTSNEEIISSIQRSGRKYLSKEDTIVNPQELLKILSEAIAKRSSGASGRDQLTKLEILANQLNYRMDRFGHDIESVRLQVDSNSKELYGGPGQEGMDTRISQIKHTIGFLIEKMDRLEKELEKKDKASKDVQEIIGFAIGIRKIFVWAKENHMAILSVLLGIGGFAAAIFKFK
jgi:CheY-like chemotaxis protein